MSNLNFEDKITKILTEMSGDYWEHMTCSDECGKKTMEKENLKDYIDQIKQLISEVVGEDEVKRDVPPNKNDSYESLNAQFKVMKYNQEKLPIVNEFRKELRHAFNLKGE